MSDVIYEASVYSRTVKYTNFKGETQSTTLYFALEPLKLMRVIAGFKPKTNTKSGDPAKRGKVEAITDDQQLKLIQDLAAEAAGWPSDDGETWEPFEDFSTRIAGQAFLTKLASSDGDRKEFTEKVILAPFRTFVQYAEQDDTNSKEDVAQLRRYLAQVENIFKTPDVGSETPEERRARLQAELDSLGTPSDGE